MLGASVADTDSLSLSTAKDKLTNLVNLTTQICETPAPTFEEAARAGLITDLWHSAGLKPTTDKVGNVLAELPGGAGPKVLVAAHLDTVFPAATDVEVKRSENRLAAPGIGDNSASLAVLTYYLKRALQDNLGRPRITAVATVGEEGLGDLCGVRELLKTKRDADAFIAIDGHLGTVVDKAVGSKRFEVRFRAKGGHSWGDYPSPSAVHALASAVHALIKLDVPKLPRSSLNVGQIGGGTSVNAIAQEAFFNLDLRSLDPEVLGGLERDALTQIRRVARSQSVQIEVKRVGDRPVGRSDNAHLVNAAKGALRALDVIPRTAPSSTDANMAMAAGIPAITFGVYKGGDAHRLSEWLEPASLATGYDAFAKLMEILAEA